MRNATLTRLMATALVAGRRPAMRGHIRNNAVGYIALFFALTFGTAWAASLPKNSVGPRQIKANAVGTSEAQDNALTGQDVNETTLGTVPSAGNAQSAATAESANVATSAQNAELLDNLNSTDFLRSDAKSIDADRLDGEDSAAFARAGSEAWHEVGAPGEPAFHQDSACSWSNFDGIHNSAAFLRDRFGFVHLKGLVDADDGGFTCDAAAAIFGTIGYPIFELPAGYKPANREVNVTITNAALGRVDVQGPPQGPFHPRQGTVMVMSPTTVDNAKEWLSLDGITFRCAPSGSNGCP